MVTLGFSIKTPGQFWHSFLSTPLQLRRSRSLGFWPPNSRVGSEVLVPGGDSGPTSAEYPSWAFLWVCSRCVPLAVLPSVHLTYVH